VKKNQLYEVLYPISPEQGPIIHPAPAASDGVPVEPVLVDNAIFATDDAADIERRAGILIEKGYLRRYEPADKPTTTKDNAKE